MSLSISLILITCVPAITAMRSRITAPESTAPERSADKAGIRTQLRFLMMLEGLPNGKEKLEMADALRRALAVARQLGLRNVRIAVQYLSRCSGESHIGRGIDAVGEIRADGSYRRAIANSNTHVMDHVVEILPVVLVKAERYVAHAGIDVAHVVEQHPLNILPDERKAQLDIVNE